MATKMDITRDGKLILNKSLKRRQLLLKDKILAEPAVMLRLESGDKMAILSYYPMLFVLFFIFMLGVTAYRTLKTGDSERKKTDTTEIDKHMHPKCGVSEDEILDALKSENIDYLGVQ